MPLATTKGFEVRGRATRNTDEACEGALYDLAAFRDFCRIDLGRERAPDATTLINFRRLLDHVR